MFAKFSWFIRELIYDGGKPSRTGFIGIIGFVAGVFFAFLATAYAAAVSFLGHPWNDYGIFLNYCFNTSGTGGAAQVANKFINSKYNSTPGCTDVNPNPVEANKQGDEMK